MPMTISRHLFTSRHAVRNRYRAWLGLTVGAFGGLTSTQVHAEGKVPEAVRFVYDAPATCPDEVSFVQEVTANGEELRRAAGMAEARTFSVVLRTSPTPSGRLVVRDAAGTETERAAVGATCEQVAKSLALFVALALEPREPLPSAPPIDVPIDEPTRASSQSAAPRLPRWRLGVSLQGALEGGAMSTAMPGLAAYVEVAREASTPFAPSLRLGFQHATYPDNTTVGGVDGVSGFPVATVSTTFTRDVGRLDACPVRWASTPAWSASVLSAQPCARLDAGVLRAEGSSASARSAHFPWVAPGALLRLRWSEPRWFVDAEAGAVFPLVRERFTYAPGFLVHEVPGAAGVGGIAFGLYLL
jgi:hypothetical protein